MTNIVEGITFENHPALTEPFAAIKDSGLLPEIYKIVANHLADPRLLAAELIRTTGVTTTDLKEAYRFLQTNTAVRSITSSWYYPYRMYYDYIKATLLGFLADTNYFDSLLHRKPTFSRILEIHPSKGTCDYGCVMCLWSDKKHLTYATQSLNAYGLMQIGDWERVLQEAYTLGTRTVVFSGGGEIFLNSQVFEILEVAHTIGLKIHIYTNGYSIPIENDTAIEKILLAEQIRFSIHSPREDTYNKITNMPMRKHALKRVCDNISTLISKRNNNLKPKIGIGFVIQPYNINEIIEMADFAVAVGVDFLNIRKDEVDVTEALSTSQLLMVQQQMIAVRNGMLNAAYGDVFIDMSDELISIANGFPIRRRRAHECMIKLIRPTISPFGVLAPCDLKAEPRFAEDGFTFGHIKQAALSDISKQMAATTIPDACVECMPSSRTGNIAHAKLLADYRFGVGLTEQPFYSAEPTTAFKEDR